MAGPEKHINISTSQALKKATALKKLRWPLRLTWVGMLAERFTRAFWPLWSLVFVVWSSRSFGVQDRLNLESAYFLTIGSVAGLVWLLISGLRKFHWPGQGDAVERLDRSMKNRPLTALWDHQAIGAHDGLSRDVWDAHVARMAKQAAGAKTVQPDLKVSGLDPFGLRYLAATALAVALLFGSIDRGDSLIKSLDPKGGALVAQGPIFEGWIEPPRYTGLPTLYLNDLTNGPVVPIPEGSKIILRLYGAADSVTVSQDISGDSIDLAAGSAVNGQEFIVTQSGSLTLTGPKNISESWRFEVIADLPPTIDLIGEVTRTPTGAMELSFEAADDYGVQSGAVTLSLDLQAVDRRYGLALPPEPRLPVVLDLPLPFNGKTVSFEDTMIEDLAEHPFAGLPATLHLQVDDAAGQISDNAPVQIIMPGRRFFDPLAASVAQMRRDILWNRDNARRVAQVIRATTNYPEDIFDNEKAFLVVRTALRRIESNQERGLSDAVRDDVADLLWRAALLLEDGQVSNAAERLRRAQEQLSEALKNGATDQEIAHLMDELRQATQDYLEALARETERNSDQQNAENQPTQEITSDQLQQMMDRIQELADQGRKQEAQALLDQLRQLMENMQTARRDPNQQGQGPGQQSMQDLQDTLRQQQDLSDEAFRQLQEQFNQDRQQGQQQGQNGQNGQLGQNNRDGNLSPGELAGRQEALRELLDQQRAQVPDSDTAEGRASREALDRAERQMGAARDALENGDTAQALDNQAEALEALRDGIQNLGQDIARSENPNQGRQGDQAGAIDPSQRQDPLGRRVGTKGRVGSEESLLSDKDVFQRSREIMDEIRRRSGDRQRPRIELDYLQRLQERF